MGESLCRVLPFDNIGCEWIAIGSGLKLVEVSQISVGIY